MSSTAEMHVHESNTFSGASQVNDKNYGSSSEHSGSEYVPNCCESLAAGDYYSKVRYGDETNGIYNESLSEEENEVLDSDISDQRVLPDVSHHTESKVFYGADEQESIPTNSNTHVISETTTPKELFQNNDHDSGFSKSGSNQESNSGSQSNTGNNNLSGQDSLISTGENTVPKLPLVSNRVLFYRKVPSPNSSSYREDGSSQSGLSSEDFNTIPNLALEPLESITNHGPAESNDNELSPLLQYDRDGTSQQNSLECNSKIPVHVKVFTYKNKTLTEITCIVPVVKPSSAEDPSVHCDPKDILRECAKQTQIPPLYSHMFGLWLDRGSKWLLLSEPYTPNKGRFLEYRVRYTVDATDGENCSSRVVKINDEEKRYPVMSNEVIKYLFHQRRHNFLKKYPNRSTANVNFIKQYRPELCRGYPDRPDDEVLIPAVFDFFSMEVKRHHKDCYNNPLKLLPDASRQSINSSAIRSIIMQYFLKKRFHKLVLSFTGSTGNKPVEYYYQKYIDYVKSLEPRFHTEVFVLANENGLISVDGDNGIIICVKDLTAVLEDNVTLDAPNGLRLLQEPGDKAEEVIQRKLDFADIGDINLKIKEASTKVFLSDLLGRQMILEFTDMTEAQSFVECVVGYTRLLVDFNTDLPSSTCNSRSVHGPVTNKFLRCKLESSSSQYACAYRQSMNIIGEYEMMVKVPKVIDCDAEYEFRSLSILKNTDGTLTLESGPGHTVKFRHIDEVILCLATGKYKAHFDLDVNKAFRNILQPCVTDSSGLVVQRASKTPDNTDVQPQMKIIPQNEIANIKTNIGFPPGYFAKVSIREYTGGEAPIMLTSLFTGISWSMKHHINVSLAESLKDLFITSHHCHVIKQLGVTVSEEKIFEYSEHGDIVSYLTDSLYTKKSDNQVNVTGSWLIQVFYQLAHALNFFESKKIAHGAIRAKNIILFRTTPNPIIKLTHAGVKTIIRERSESQFSNFKELPALTPPWIAKEYCEFARPDPLKTSTIDGDKWSFATTVCEIAILAEKNTPLEDGYTVLEFSDEMRERYISGKVMVLPSWIDSNSIPLKFTAVLRQCWRDNPQHRPTFSTMVRLLATLMHNGVGQKESFSLPNRMRGRSEEAQIIPDPVLILLKEDPIGTGHYGKVNLCEHKTTKEKLAVKEINNMTGIWSWDNFAREFQTMLTVKHENIVAVKGIALPSNRIVMEYLPMGSLNNFLEKNRHKISNNERIKFGQDIARGMMELEKNKILHRDLALRNVLVAKKANGSYVAKISDFGLARYVAENHYYYTDLQSGQTCFPFRWYAPECLEGGYVQTRFESEVWSYGITLWELFSEPNTSMPSGEPKKLMKKIKRKEWPNHPNNCSTDIYDNVILKCCQFRPEDRFTFQQAIDALEREKNSYFTT